MPPFRSPLFRIAAAPIPIALLALVLHIGSAAGQTGTWATPTSGYIYDAVDRSIRPVTGLVGSAIVGPPVAGGIDWLSVAPNQTWAFARSNGLQIWIPNLSAASASQALNRMPMAQQAIWSLDASQAVILAAGEQLIWLNNFAASPATVSTWNLETYSRSASSKAETAQLRSPARQAVWSLLAADSAANQVLLTLHAGESWQIWLASSTAPPVEIPFSGLPRAAAFAPGNGSVFLADAIGHRIVQIQNLHPTPSISTVFSSEVYLKDPTALVLSADGTQLFAADAVDKVIRIFEIASPAAASGSTAPTQLAVGTAPLSLNVFAPHQFVLNDGIIAGQSATQPVFILDTAVPAKVSFVPREQ